MACNMANFVVSNDSLLTAAYFVAAITAVLYSVTARRTQHTRAVGALPLPRHALGTLVGGL